MYFTEVHYEDNDEQYYDYADSRNLTNVKAKEEKIHLESMKNPYYGGNDYVVIHGNSCDQQPTSDKISTLKIVNNVYYE